MTLSIFVLKTALLRFGVIIDQVRFDVNGETIVVEYQLHGVASTKSVPFAEIEDLFSESTARPPAALPGADRPAEGPPAGG